MGIKHYQEKNARAMEKELAQSDIPVKRKIQKIIRKLDNSKLGSTQHMLTLTCCQDHILTPQKIYGLYGLKHHIVEMRGGVTDAGRTNKRTNIEDRATQPMEAGG